MTAALEGGEWSAARPGRTLPPGKARYLCYRRLGRSQGRSGRAENLVPTGIRSRTFKPVVSRYTDWVTGPTKCLVASVNSSNKAIISARVLGHIQVSKLNKKINLKLQYYSTARLKTHWFVYGMFKASVLF